MDGIFVTKDMFKPEILQFFADNLADPNGLWSGTAKEIADTLFKKSGVRFSTSPLGE